MRPLPFFRTTAATLLLAATMAAHAQTPIDPNARYCDVSMDVLVNGKSVASPDAVVEFGKEAEVTIRDQNHPHGWQLRFTINEPTTIRRVLAMPADIQLFELADERSFLRAEPHASLVPGQPAHLEMALEDGRKIALTVTASIVSGAEVQAHLDAAAAQAAD